MVRAGDRVAEDDRALWSLLGRAPALDPESRPGAGKGCRVCLVSRQGLLLCYAYKKIRLWLQSEKEPIVRSLGQLRCHWGTADSHGSGGGTGASWPHA